MTEQTAKTKTMTDDDFAESFIRAEYVFEWGKVDCYHLAIKWIGHFGDPNNIFGGKTLKPYKTEEQALSRLRSVHGCDSMGGLLDKYYVQPTYVKPKNGEIGLVYYGSGKIKDCFAFVYNSKAYFLVQKKTKLIPAHIASIYTFWTLKEAIK